MCVSQAWIWLRINRPVHIEEGMRAGRILFSCTPAGITGPVCSGRRDGHKACPNRQMFRLHFLKRVRRDKVMSRRKIRELVFKMIFRVEFYTEEERPEQLALFLDGLEETKEDDCAYIERKVTDIFSHLKEIDEIIDGSAQNWKTSRMAKVELSLIRLAVYELRFEEGIPTGVAINEAVELAKLYGEENSASFVNGVLARIA